MSDYVWEWNMALIGIAERVLPDSIWRYGVQN
jgi:hypothetical protein